MGFRNQCFIGNKDITITKYVYVGRDLVKDLRPSYFKVKTLRGQVLCHDFEVSGFMSDVLFIDVNFSRHISISLLPPALGVTIASFAFFHIVLI